ncbi:DUF1707 domain-containing protein [Streptomyces sp. SID3343]|uniref:DUF1707 SHOCT-like domain-containing protein n=1 Tax=Streptomyces sp. SID3343 TaxID=2690260 RepID=UPI0013688340|nr:DUF1707 domain-containing protein [Streptomyces sp. SID3343]MYW06163.1 DUF1707 domain-containing protein [Streptomyces sp. SID3343]
MDRDPQAPATPADREQATARLREHLAGGHLGLSEYRACLDAVRRAGTVGELDAVSANLPGRPDRDDAVGATPPPEYHPHVDAPRAGAYGPAGERRQRVSNATLNKVWLVVMSLGVLTWALVYFLK